MGKAILLSMVLMACGLSKSQGQQFVSSHGEVFRWSLPYEVYHRIQHDYYRYDVVHVARVSRYRQAYFDVVLRRGGVFVKVRMTPFGRVIYRERNFPFDYRRHRCDRACGFDQQFYRDAVCRPVMHEGHFHDRVADRDYCRDSNYSKSRVHARSRGHARHQGHARHHKSKGKYPKKRYDD